MEWGEYAGMGVWPTMMATIEAGQDTADIDGI